MKNIFLTAAAALMLVCCQKKEKNSETMAQNQSSTDWIHTTNIYEVNTRQYTPEGTFKAFQKELPRLKDMGVKTLWFMPITPIAQEKKKGSLGSPYACSDYVSVNPEFGTLEDFKDLVKTAHEQGFKVIIDWVANHTGWDHVWTKTHHEYYLHEPDGSFHIASGMDDIIELDYSKPELRKAMIDAMKFWLQEADIDGFRCDLASWVEVDFWQQARPEIEKIKPIFMLGEYDELENPDYGKVFDASYSWAWMHKTEDFYKKNLPLTELADLLRQYSNIGNGSMRAWFTSNHDENSWNGTEYEKYGDMAKALAVFSVTWNGVPLMYSGQELPMTNKRLEFFEKDPIPWTGTNQLHDFYKKLFTLKSENPALRGGDDAATTTIIETSKPEQIFCYLRKNGGNEVLTVLNLSKHQAEFSVENKAATGKYKELFTDAEKDFAADKNISLNPYEYLVFVK